MVAMIYDYGIEGMFILILLKVVFGQIRTTYFNYRLSNRKNFFSIRNCFYENLRSLAEEYFSYDFLIILY